MATKFLSGLLRRDIVPSPGVAKFFMDHTISPQPTIRWSAQTYVSPHKHIYIWPDKHPSAVVKLSAFIKYRTYAKDNTELWLEQWTNPLQTQIPVTDKLIESLQRPVEDERYAWWFACLLVWSSLIVLFQRTIHRQNTHWFRGMVIVTEGLYTRGSSHLTLRMAKGMPTDP